MPDEGSYPPSSWPSSREAGDQGEMLAAEYLRKEGYRIVMANFTAPIGRNSKDVQIKGEIDIVALDGETLCFVEVKTRRNVEFAGPLANIDLRKRRVVTRTARVYKRIFNVGHIQHRFDVVSVVDDSHFEPVIELHKGYWSESSFRKRAWADDRF